MRTMVIQNWEESERGWGVEEDGWSVHKTSADRDAFIAEYWESMPDATPSVYSRPSGSPRIFEVTEELAKEVDATKNGYRTYRRVW